MKSLHCFVCKTKLENFEYEGVGVHPIGGLHFRTYGHYGSGLFDPMDDTSLDIAICDRCVEINKKYLHGSGVVSG